MNRLGRREEYTTGDRCWQPTSICRMLEVTCGMRKRPPAISNSYFAHSGAWEYRYADSPTSPRSYAASTIGGCICSIVLCERYGECYAAHFQAVILLTPNTI